MARCTARAIGLWFTATSGSRYASAMPLLAPPPPAKRSTTSSFSKGRAREVIHVMLWSLQAGAALAGEAFIV
ncbi:hypothetical protein D3C79_960060 [compost metagenome]